VTEHPDLRQVERRAQTVRKGAVLGVRICGGGQAREFVEHEPGVRDPDRVNGRLVRARGHDPSTAELHLCRVVGVVDRDHDVAATGQIRYQIRAGLSSANTLLSGPSPNYPEFQSSVADNRLGHNRGRQRPAVLA
jgi:hypothetical protein